MNYSDVRAQIRTGDLIAFRKRHGLLATLTRWITKSPYNHTALVIWVGLGEERRLLVAEQKASGAFLTPLSQYAGDDFDVFDAPHEVDSTTPPPAVRSQASTTAQLILPR